MLLHDRSRSSLRVQRSWLAMAGLPRREGWRMTTSAGWPAGWGHGLSCGRGLGLVGGCPPKTSRAVGTIGQRTGIIESRQRSLQREAVLSDRVDGGQGCPGVCRRGDGRAGTWVVESRQRPLQREAVRSDRVAGGHGCPGICRSDDGQAGTWVVENRQRPLQRERRGRTAWLAAGVALDVRQGGTARWETGSSDVDNNPLQREADEQLRRQLGADGRLEGRP